MVVLSAHRAPSAPVAASWILLAGFGLTSACSDAPLWKLPPEPPPPVDNILRVAGGFCTQDPNTVLFPLKILFVVDTSNSMGVTDPPNPADANFTNRGRSVVDMVTALAGFPGVDFASRISLRRQGLVGDVSMDYLTPGLHRRAHLRGAVRMHDFDFAAQLYRVTDANGPRLLDLPLERNAMFMEAMRDFLALASGGETSGNPLMPRLDRCLDSARLVARAWAGRSFVGEIAKEIP